MDDRYNPRIAPTESLSPLVSHIERLLRAFLQEWSILPYGSCDPHFCLHFRLSFRFLVSAPFPVTERCSVSFSHSFSPEGFSFRYSAFAENLTFSRVFNQLRGTDLLRVNASPLFRSGKEHCFLLSFLTLPCMYYSREPGYLIFVYRKTLKHLHVSSFLLPNVSTTQFHFWYQLLHKCNL